MATKLNDKYLSDFIGEHEYDGVVHLPTVKMPQFSAPN